MTDPVLFVAAVLALLATPGPTNTLLAAASALDGPWRALRLVPAELAGYLTAIGLLVVVAGPAVAAEPAVGIAIRAGAALWLAHAAVRLWREAGDGFAGTASPVTAGRVFVTTLLNPKALVFAFVVLPVDHLAVALPAFAGLVVVVAAGWIAAGRLLAAAGRGRLPARLVTRFAAGVLGLFATLLAGSALASGL